MAYDQDKDVLIEDLGPIQDGDCNIFGELRSYDGGPTRVSIYKLIGRKEKKVQMFRVSIEEGRDLGEFLLTELPPR